MKDPEGTVWSASQAFETEKLMEIGKMRAASEDREGRCWRNRGQSWGRHVFILPKKWGGDAGGKVKLGNEDMCLLLEGSGDCSSSSSAKEKARGFPGGTLVKNPPAKAGDMGSSPGPGGSHMPWSN